MDFDVRLEVLSLFSRPKRLIDDTRPAGERNLDPEKLPALAEGL